MAVRMLPLFAVSLSLHCGNVFSTMTCTKVNGYLKIRSRYVFTFLCVHVRLEELLLMRNNILRFSLFLKRKYIFTVNQNDIILSVC